MDLFKTSTSFLKNFSDLVNWEKALEMASNPNFIKKINTQLSPYSSSLSPKIIQVSGIPGSGKTTFCNYFLKENHFFYLSFDHIMNFLPDYQSCCQEKGIEKAFEIFENQARILGYLYLYYALLKKINILFEHSGAHKSHVFLMSELKKAGWETSIYYLSCSLDTAITRVKKREKFISRHTPSSLIKERFSLIQDYPNLYKKVGCSLQFFSYKNKALTEIDTFF